MRRRARRSTGRSLYDVDDAASAHLVEAVLAADTAAVARALAMGADPDIPTGRFRGSVLSAAASRGDVPTVQLLLDAGATPGPSDPNHSSPLRGAVHEARTAVAELLIEHGALNLEPTGPDRPPSLASDAIAYAGYFPQRASLDVLRLLLHNSVGPAGWEEPLLVQAVTRRATPAVLRVLLDQGADPRVRRSDGAPALVLAARRRDHAAVDVLVQAGADVDAADDRQRTALMHAVERGATAIVATLLLAGADTGRFDVEGTTALALARAEQDHRAQFMLGEQRAGSDDMPMTQTDIRSLRRSVHLRGDKSALNTLATVVEVVAQQLGEDWETRTGVDAREVSGTVALLRTGATKADGASWCQVELSHEQMRTVNNALTNADRTTARLVDGMTETALGDLRDELPFPY